MSSLVVHMCKAVLNSRVPQLVRMSVLSPVAAPQLTSVVLTSFRNGTFELSLQYDQQVCLYRSSVHIG